MGLGLGEWKCDLFYSKYAIITKHYFHRLNKTETEVVLFWKYVAGNVLSETNLQLRLRLACSEGTVELNHSVLTQTWRVSSQRFDLICLCVDGHASTCSSELAVMMLDRSRVTVVADVFFNRRPSSSEGDEIIHCRCSRAFVQWASPLALMTSSTYWHGYVISKF